MAQQPHSNQLERIMGYANAGKQLYAPTKGVQEVVNADGTTTKIPYSEDRFGRRTVMTREGPQVIPGFEGKDTYGDLGGQIGNLLGGMINKGRLGRQERIAEKSVAEQEMANPGAMRPTAPANLEELNKARERMNFEMPKEKIDYFDMGGVQSSVKPSALQEKLNIYLPSGTTVGGRTVNGVRTRPATREELKAAMQAVTASSGSATTFHTPARFKDGSFSTSNNAGGLTYTDKAGTKFAPGEEGYAEAVQASVESGIQYEGDKAYATNQGKDRSVRMTEISTSIRSAEDKQGIYGEMLDALDAGANTGYFENKVPSMTEASIVLDNLQAQLGLNVISNTTFGALSESELKFALDSAAPKSLEPEALKAWLLRKQTAQRKLIDYLYEAGDYIGQGGNEFGFMAKKRRENKGQTTQQKPTASNLDFLPEGERAEAQQAIDSGEVTLEQLRESLE
mgnify:FL=1